VKDRVGWSAVGLPEADPADSAMHAIAAATGLIERQASADD
jgi:hypothetical protein